MKTPFRIAFWVVIFAFMGLFIACKPSVPRQYIQEREMANILYDYHVADAMVAEAPGGNKHWYEYRNAVFEKHKITEEDFNTSMNYYYRYPDRLLAVYEKVSERLSKEARAQGLAISDMDKFGELSHSSDTSNVWTGSSGLVLSLAKPSNLHSFVIEADTSYRAGDNLLLSFDTEFIVQDGSREGVAAIAVQYNNDSIASNMIRIYSSSHYMMRVEDPHHEGIKKIRGFIIATDDNGSHSKSTLHLMVVSNIRLFRIHERQKKEEFLMN